MPRDLPFDGKTQKFIAFYAQFEDLQKAAEAARITAAAAKKLYRNRDVRAEIEHRLDMVYREQAKLEAKAKRVEVTFLDDQLVRAAKNGAAKGDVKAIEMGYERLGLRREGVFLFPAQPSGAAPQIYRAMERTVTRTEQITERAVETVPGQIEILQY